MRHPRIFTDEQEAFIREKASFFSSRELLQEVNSKYNLSIAITQLRFFLSSRKIKTVKKPRENKVFPDNVREFLDSNYKGITTNELVEKVNLKFGTSYTWQQIRDYKNTRGLKCGVNSHFKPGRTPYNKGMKGFYPEGAEKSWFTTDDPRRYYTPVGEERKTRDGYTLVKISKTRWVYKHRYVFEQHYGRKVKPDCVLIFKDGNIENCDISNLEEVTRKTCLKMSSMHLRSSNPELTMAGIGLVTLQEKIKELENSKGN